jgi:hypothetical protein
MNSNKCRHGFELDKNGHHIIPSNTAIPISEEARVYKDRLGYLHNTPQTEPKEKSIDELLEEGKKLLQKEKSTAELLEEAKKLFPQKKEPEPVPLTKQQTEFEAHIQKWRKYYEENKGKIPAGFPKTIFDKDE